MPGLIRSTIGCGSEPGGQMRSRSAICERTATATSSNSAIRARSGMSAVSISAHRAGRSNKRSAATNIAAMSSVEAPSSSASSSGCRSEEHTSELQSLLRISYAVFCLKKNKKPQNNTYKLHEIDRDENSTVTLTTKQSMQQYTQYYDTLHI